MDSVFVEYSIAALFVRELLNIGHVVLIPPLVFVFVRYIYGRWNDKGRVYKLLPRPVKGLIGIAIFFSSDWVRAATIWFILHTFGVQGNYLTDVIPLIASLLVGTTGLLCAIRNFTPEADRYGRPLSWGGHRLWIGSLCVYVLVATFNWTVL